MSVKDAGSIFMISAVDGAAGLLTGSLVELVAPPITDQGFWRLTAEALVQLGLTVFLGKEIYTLVTRSKNSVGELPFVWGMFTGSPNTMGKLAMVGSMGRSMARQFISNPQGSESAAGGTPA
jgi:hypothetical protein